VLSEDVLAVGVLLAEPDRAEPACALEAEVKIHRSQRREIPRSACGITSLTSGIGYRIVLSMITTQKTLESTGYKNADGAYVASAYCNKGHWYAADADGEDLDGGWRLDSRDEAERIAYAHALRVA
jgi:hypothetical protein